MAPTCGQPKQDFARPAKMEDNTPGPSAANTISYAGQRLLGAIDAPPDMDGAALAARHVRNCVLQAAKTYSAAVPQEWGPEAAALYDALRRASENGQSKLMALPDSSAGSDAYKAFTARRRDPSAATRSPNP